MNTTVATVTIYEVVEDVDYGLDRQAVRRFASKDQAEQYAARVLCWGQQARAVEARVPRRALERYALTVVK